MARTERSETYDCMQAQPLVPAQCFERCRGYSTVPKCTAMGAVICGHDASHIVIICLAESGFVGTSSAVLVRALLQ
jgi:hypothetical protein